MEIKIGNVGFEEKKQLRIEVSHKKYNCRLHRTEVIIKEIRSFNRSFNRSFYENDNLKIEHLVENRRF